MKVISAFSSLIVIVTSQHPSTIPRKAQYYIPDDVCIPTVSSLEECVTWCANKNIEGDAAYLNYNYGDWKCACGDKTTRCDWLKPFSDWEGVPPAVGYVYEGADASNPVVLYPRTLTFCAENEEHCTSRCGKNTPIWKDLGVVDSEQKFTCSCEDSNGEVTRVPIPNCSFVKAQEAKQLEAEQPVEEDEEFGDLDGSASTTIASSVLFAIVACFFTTQ
eukprot:GHVL01010734.1.p1 GENE.GHVL01010734.1~~GHVL01010734.1.p1  ORF type:complete len:218 (+),score=28.90 GHVL01010734.1:77-730(+)